MLLLKKQTGDKSIFQGGSVFLAFIPGLILSLIQFYTFQEEIHVCKILKQPKGFLQVTRHSQSFSTCTAVLLSQQSIIARNYQGLLYLQYPLEQNPEVIQSILGKEHMNFCKRILAHILLIATVRQEIEAIVAKATATSGINKGFFCILESTLPRMLSFSHM